MIKQHQKAAPYTLSIKVDGLRDIDAQFAKPLSRELEDILIPNIIDLFNVLEKKLISIDFRDNNGNVIATYYSAKEN